EEEPEPLVRPVPRKPAQLVGRDRDPLQMRRQLLGLHDLGVDAAIEVGGARGCGREHGGHGDSDDLGKPYLRDRSGTPARRRVTRYPMPAGERRSVARVGPGVAAPRLAAWSLRRVSRCPSWPSGYGRFRWSTGTTTIRGPIATWPATTSVRCRS